MYQRVKLIAYFKANFYLYLILFTEEIITKRTTELITTKNIETRTKRNILLQGGKVIEDSGPIVETNTTEDVEKQESEQTEVILIVITFSG